MTLRLNGSTSGYTEIDAPASAGNNTLRLPTGNGAAGNILGTDGSGNLSWVNGRMVLETAKTATGTEVDFTGIPSWVKRITVMFSGVSTNGTSNWLVQLGDAGGIEGTGYLSYGLLTGVSAVSGGATYTTGFGLAVAAAAANCHGQVTLTTAGSNTWTCNGILARTDAANGIIVAGAKTLSDTLAQIRVTTSGGTNTFDAGTINILYEG